MAHTTIDDAHAAHHHEAHDHHELGFWRKYIFSTDHKVIGLQYGITGLVFLFFGFCLMLLMRWQLAHPGTVIPVIGKLLGHTQASTTQRYAHLDADPVRRAADTIAGQISAALNGKKK